MGIRIRSSISGVRLFGKNSITLKPMDHPGTTPLYLRI